MKARRARKPELIVWPQTKLGLYDLQTELFAFFGLAIYYCGKVLSLVSEMYLASTACTFPGSLSFPTVNRSSGNDAAMNTPQELGVCDSHMLNLFAIVPLVHCACCAEVLSILDPGSQQMIGSI